MRCFVAVELNEKVRESLANVLAVCRQTGVDFSFTAPAALHCTLAFLGEKNDAEVQKTIASLGKIMFKKFPVTCKGLGFFPSEGFARIFWAGLQSPGLIELQKQVASALDYADGKPFSPHVTLGRIRSRRNLPSLVQYARANSSADFGSFQVEKFALKKSTLSPKGAVHEAIAEFALV